MIQYLTRNKGFTLLELLLVVAIIGILVGIILVSLGGTRAKARDGKGETEVKQIMAAFELIYTKEGQYPNLPDGIENIPDDDNRLAPYLDPVPYTSGNVNYRWYNGGDNQKFCVLFGYEAQEGFFTCSHRGCYVSASAECPDF